MNLNFEDKKTLLEFVRKSINSGLETGRPFEPNLEKVSSDLRKDLATFVTLYLNDALKGCVGSIKAVQPLIKDACRNAYLAAFYDNRFSPVTHEEIPYLKVEISILSIPEKINVHTETEIIDYLEKDKCGLILKYGSHQATFLPSVWEKILKPVDFLKHLKKKAGLDPDFWSDKIEFLSYHTEKISEE